MTMHTRTPPPRSYVDQYSRTKGFSADKENPENANVRLEGILEGPEIESLLGPCMQRSIVSTSLQSYGLGSHSTMLGGGGFGQVLSATCPESGISVALKFNNAPTAVKRRCTIWEGEVLQRLDHPNIIKLYAWFEVDMKVILVLEQMHKSLAMHLAGSPHRHLRESEAGFVFADICQGMHHIHRCGISHRDISDDNVLLTFDGRAKLADFGIAAASLGQQLLYWKAGKEAWQAPEIRTGKGYIGSLADIWSLGLVLRVMLSSPVPVQPQHVLDRMLQPDPSSRLMTWALLSLPWVVQHVRHEKTEEDDLALTRIGRSASIDRVASPSRSQSPARKKMMEPARSTTLTPTPHSTLVVDQKAERQSKDALDDAYSCTRYAKDCCRESKMFPAGVSRFRAAPSELFQARPLLKKLVANPISTTIRSQDKKRTRQLAQSRSLQASGLRRQAR